MQHVAPPPSRPPGMNYVRVRRSSAPFATSQKDLNAVLAAAAVRENSRSRGDANEQHKPSSMQSPATCDTEEGANQLLRLSSQQPSRHEPNDSAALVASLQQNVQGLTASNQREKAMAEYLKKQIQALTTELTKTKELYEEEKTKNEKVTAMRKNQKGGGGEYGGYLPDIHSAAAAAAAAAALQQQAQLELTYQRKILSLENRCKDFMENNKRLLRKIEQLEKTEKDADIVIEDLRQENVRLGTQNDSLSGTVASQSSLIIGLRTSLQKLNQEEQHIGTLLKKFDRSQIELEATKVREKMLRDDHERLKLIMSKEKEALMAKIMEFQQQLHQSRLAGDDIEALHDRIHRLESEKRVVGDEMITLRENAVKAEERMHDQEQMTNRLLLENEIFQGDKRDLLAKISRLQDEIDSKAILVEKLAMLQQREQEVERLMATTVELQGELDFASREKAKLVDQINALKQTQLSHDETVQALQLARQKAATHEALALVNEEKMQLEQRLQALQDEWRTERATLVRRIHELEAEERVRREELDEVRGMIAVLRDRQIEQVMIQADARPSTAEVEERAQVAADIERLRNEYSDLRETFDNIEREYNKLITKKYKTEAFQSQVKLLQNENNELSSRIEGLLLEQKRDHADLQSRAIEIVELQSRVIDPNAIDMLRRTQESLENTVSLLVEAEIASESTFTCLQCMRLFVSPMTLTPCGHTYCASCMDSMGDSLAPSSIVCKECSTNDKQETESIFPNQALADLTARFLFRQQTLSSLTTMCLSLRNSFANRSQS